MDARQSFYLNSNHDDRVQRTAKAIGPMRSLFHMSRLLMTMCQRVSGCWPTTGACFVV